MAPVIHLPWPPSVNSIWRQYRGRTILSKKGRAFFAGAAPMAAQSGVKVSGPYRLHITATRPDKRRRDIGNLEKVISDALVKGGVVDDDCLCVSITIQWADADLCAPLIQVEVKNEPF